MQDRDRGIRINVGLMIFGALFGIACAVMILVGVVGATLWFTVIAMALLLLSQWLTIRQKRRGS